MENCASDQGARAMHCMQCRDRQWQPGRPMLTLMSVCLLCGLGGAPYPALGSSRCRLSVIVPACCYQVISLLAGCTCLHTHQATGLTAVLITTSGLPSPYVTPARSCQVTCCCMTCSSSLDCQRIMMSCMTAQYSIIIAVPASGWCASRQTAAVCTQSGQQA